MTIEVVEFIQSLRTGFGDSFFNLISFLGEEYVYIFVLSIVYYALDKRLGEILGFSLFVTGIINAVLKSLIGAMRPFEKYPDRIVNLRPDTAGGYSFPSGHTQLFTTFTFTAAFRKQSRLLLWTAIILSVLMAISRMYLGVHFLEDVAVSLILGVAIAYGMHHLFSQLTDKGKFKLYWITVAVGAVFLFTRYEDFYKTYGLLVGFVGGMQIEQRRIQFTLDVVLWKKVIRVAGGLILMIAIMVGLGAAFDTLATEGTDWMNILDFVRYGLISFIGLGVYPFLFQRFHF